MNPLIAFAILGLVIHQAVAFARHAFDPHDHWPKAVWVMVPWGLGIALAEGICAFHKIALFFHLPTENCVPYILVGLGFGSVASFWHSLLGYLGASHQSTNPEGLKVKPKP